jgi:heme/copper-type cytochrome/quinol oxidase subunit 2
MRLLGITHSGRTVSQLARTLVPLMWGALGVLLLTGVIQTIAEPVRQFVTPWFWAKMIMIVVVMAMTVVFTTKIRASAAAWDAPAPRPSGARQFAIASTLLWVAIIVCGRFVGYTWSDYL